MAYFKITFQATADVDVEADNYNAAIRQARQQLDPDVDWDVSTGKEITEEEFDGA